MLHKTEEGLFSIVVKRRTFSLITRVSGNPNSKLLLKSNLVVMNKYMPNIQWTGYHEGIKGFGAWIVSINQVIYGLFDRKLMADFARHQGKITLGLPSNRS